MAATTRSGGRRWLIWIAGGIGGLLALILAAAAGGLLFVRASLPMVDGTVEVAGIDGRIEIVRNHYGVPHITATSRADAYFALGFVHAQDRLWQMEVGRRSGAGRLSEVFGERTLDADRYLRTLGSYRLAERSFRTFDPDAQRLVTAYAAGVNAWIERAGTPLPPEFLFFRHAPEAWTPADSVVLVTMMALQLSGNAHEEMLRSRLAARLTPEQIAALWPPYPDDAPIALAEVHPALHDMPLAELAAIMPPSPRGLGSNNWVVDGRNSESGAPLLATDLHLGLTAPAPWYLVHLSAPGIEVVGGTLPGIPAVVVGRNDRIAWGMTNTGPDVQDLFIERIDPNNPERYLTPDGAEPFATRDEVIRVKGGNVVVQTVRETRHGPVISDASTHYQPAEGHVLALKWTALRDDVRTVQAGIEMAEARDWDSFVAALRNFHGPQQNIVYADVDGNIGFYAPALVPIRKAGNGWLPSPGWTGEYGWTGFIPFEELPHTMNPPDGRIATANNRIVGDDYPHFITHDWASPYRIRRIEERLTALPRHSVDSFRDIQTDRLSLFARDFLPRLLAAPVDGAAAVRAHAMLSQWDGDTDPDRPEPLIFTAWYRELTRHLYADELGPLFTAAWTYRPGFVADVLDGREADWCNDVTTEVVETCDEIIAAALDDAVAMLAALYGDDPEQWRWGAAHLARNRHAAFGGVPMLGDLFNLTVEQGGDSFTVKQARHSIANEFEPFVVVHGVSIRLIFDLADLSRSQAVIPTGQSGNRLSRWYADQLPLWQGGATIPLVANPTRTDIAGHLVLEPES